ncbi:baculoviral IAP repeat-containing protein 5b [Nerophis lumbriciformis]|uniref:baculoviral IAP repeat-containing protein 5b n=1 Tax=Nerophis lumbriciformis TaxID=546530 RepID=UPI002ADF76FC|nr:baculoviral IAP repeat-containing protein 5.1-B-like [Nerophis lumbriciformis]
MLGRIHLGVVMASIDVLTRRFQTHGKMYSQDLREKTFADWPFREDCNCTPEKMAKAGFVHCPSENEPDVVCCFFCLIELEGWEPDDEPWNEHIKRSPTCGFLTMKKDFIHLTVPEFYHVEKERIKVFVRKVCHKRMACLRDEIDKVLEVIKLLH